MAINALTPTPDPMTAVRRAYEASLELATTKGVERSRAVAAMAQALQRSL
ncbi:MAG: gamma-glutamyl-phosphate reductase, partial [Cyanobacteriota bacterium]